MFHLITFDRCFRPSNGTTTNLSVDRIHFAQRSFRVRAFSGVTETETTSVRSAKLAIRIQIVLLCSHLQHIRTATAITSLNRKGGVGKTHFCWTVASACFAAGKRVLLIDLDPQANLTSSFLVDDRVDRSVELLFDPSVDPDAESLIQKTEFDGVDLIPSSSRLEPANVTDNWQDADLHLSLAEALVPCRAKYD